MSVYKILVGVILGLILLLALAMLSFMPPKDPEQTLYRTTVSQDYSPKSVTYKSRDEVHKAFYDLSFVELNDEGFFVEPAQVKQLLSDLKTKVNQTDTTILLYVHGWNHNASTNDPNVACFEELLKATAIMQSKYRSRDGAGLRGVYGIYVGWPGVVYDTEWLNKALTFFGRQSAADRVGERGHLLELFSRIGMIRDQPREQETKFVILSHSLGARLTYKALRSVMQYSVHRPGTFVADVSIMVNPALSADEHTAVAALIEEQAAQRAGNEIPRFIIATSENDEVLGGIFPLSQQLSSFVRGDYRLADKRKTLPVGLFDGYITHSLALRGRYHNPTGGNGCSTLKYDELEITKGKERTSGNYAELYNYNEIKHYDENGKVIYSTELTEFANGSRGAIMVVKVSGDIIPNHNDIFTSPFVDFVARVINAGLYRH